MNLTELVVLLTLIFLGYLFWQWRMQEEFARQHAEALCKRYQLQFLDIARESGRPRFRPRTGWEATFVFGFSSDNQSRYEATIVLMNRHLRDYKLPTYRQEAEPSSEDVTVDAKQPARSETSPAQHRFRVTYGAIPAAVPWQSASMGPQESQEEIVDAVFKEGSSSAQSELISGESDVFTGDGIS